MELAGLAIGAVGLVALTKTCRDTAERIESFLHHDAELRTQADLLRADRVWLDTWIYRHSDQFSEDAEHHGLEDSLAKRRRDAMVRLVCSLTENLQALEKLVRAPEAPDELYSSSSRARRKLRFQAQSFKSATAWSMGGRREQVQAHITTSHAIIARMQLADDIRQHDDMQALMCQVERLAVSDPRKELQIQSGLRTHMKNWIRPDSMAEVIEKHLEAKVADTASWLFERHFWEEWLETSQIDPESRLLWINGPAGFGKSVTCATAIQHLACTQGPDVHLAYYFHSSQRPESTQPLHALRTWVWQLISNDAELFDLAVSFQHHDDTETATESSLWTLFARIVQEDMRFIFVIDGLDEGRKRSEDLKAGSASLHSAFLAKLLKVMQATDIRVLIFSRDTEDVREVLMTDKPRTSLIVEDYTIKQNDIEPDLSAVAMSIVDERLHNRDIEIKQALATTMTECSGGMFLIMRLQEGKLKRYMTEKQLQWTVKQSPRELDTLYEEKWCELIRSSDEQDYRLLAMLRLLTFAKRALTVRELLDILLLDELTPEDDPAYAELLSPNNILESIQGRSGHLAVVDTDPDGQISGHSKVMLFHGSIQTFFEQKFGSIKFDDEVYGIPLTRSLPEVCTIYLNRRCSFKVGPDECSMFGAFWQYTVDWWIRHVEEEKNEGSVSLSHQHQLTRFFSSHKHFWSRWRDDYVADCPDKDKQGVPGERAYYAALLGMTFILELLLREGALSVNAIGGAYETPLNTACLSGSLDTVRFVLAAGASPRLQPGSRSVLQDAVRGKSSEVLREVLARGVTDPESTQVHDGSTATEVAASLGNHRALRLLCDAGFGVSGECLMLACEGRHVETMMYLIQQGADVNFVNSRGSPLTRASLNGHHEMTRHLLEHGADINKPIVGGATALMGSALSGNLAIATLLIKNGADMEATSNYGNTALSVAMTKHKGPMFKHLLSLGADPNPRWYLTTPRKDGAPQQVPDGSNGDCNNCEKRSQADDAAIGPLAYLARTDNPISLMEALIDSWADVNAVCDENLTVLDYYMFRDSDCADANKINLLIDRGAAIDHVTTPVTLERRANASGCHTALTLALFTAQVSAAIALLERGASTDIPFARPLNTTLNSGERVPVGSCGSDEVPSDSQVRLHWSTALNIGLTTRGFIPRTLFDLLQAKGARPTDIDHKWNNAYRTACTHTSSHGLELLIDDMSVPENQLAAIDPLGRSCLHAPLRSNKLGHLEAIPAYLQRLEKPDHMGRWPAHYFATSASDNVLYWLSDHGADLNARDRHGWTPLHWAAHFGDVDSVGTLLHLDADDDVEDNRGRSALDIALVNGHTKVADYIEFVRIEDAQTDVPEESFAQCACCYYLYQSMWYRCDECPAFFLCWRCWLDVDIFHPGHTFLVEFY